MYVDVSNACRGMRLCAFGQGWKGKGLLLRCLVWLSLFRMLSNVDHLRPSGRGDVAVAWRPGGPDWVFAFWVQSDSVA